MKLASAALHEAQVVFELLKRGETVPTLRALIGTVTPERRATLRAFDAICIRHGLLRIGRGNQKDSTGKVSAEGIAAHQQQTHVPVRVPREDVAVSHKPALKIWDPDNEVQSKVLRFLPVMSVRHVARILNISTRRVRSIAGTAGGPAALKTNGSGHGVRGQLRKQILATLQAGIAPIDVALQFRVNIITVNRLDRTLGDVRDQCRDHTLDTEQVQA